MSSLSVGPRASASASGRSRASPAGRSDTATIELDGPAAAVTESAGSWRRIASSSSRSSAPGSRPSSSSSTCLPSRNASRASACRPALYRASMSCARGRSSNGRSATSDSSSGTSSGAASERELGLDPLLHRKPAQLLESRRLRLTNCSYAKSASGAPRQSERAEPSVVARSRRLLPRARSKSRSNSSRSSSPGRTAAGTRSRVSPARRGRPPSAFRRLET